MYFFYSVLPMPYSPSQKYMGKFLHAETYSVMCLRTGRWVSIPFLPTRLGPSVCQMTRDQGVCFFPAMASMESVDSDDGQEMTTSQVNRQLGVDNGDSQDGEMPPPIAKQPTPMDPIFDKKNHPALANPQGAAGAWLEYLCL